MQMTPINSGKLRAIGYDARQRTLYVTLQDGSHLEYSAVPESVWQRLSGSSAAWSVYRDTIEETYSARHCSVPGTKSDTQALHDLFKS